MQYTAADAQRVRSLDELDNWSFAGTALAVLGDPIAHSLSPIMHNAALSAMAQTQHSFANWRYFKFSVRPEELPTALEKLHAAGFHGINLTVPHKIQALEILGSGAVSDFARTAGAANTLIRTTASNTATTAPSIAATTASNTATSAANRASATAAATESATATDAGIPHTNSNSATTAADARRPSATGTTASSTAIAVTNATTSWRGDNTDGYGLEQAVAHELNTSLTGASVLLLGAGGAARAAAVHCLNKGVKSLWIANRSAERLTPLVKSLRTIASPDQLVQGFTHGQPLPGLPLENVLIINATSIGLKADDPSPINLAPFDPLTTLVYDMTYGVENELARTARARRIPFADGLSMLVWQGVRSLEIWSDTHVPAQVMLQSLLNHRRQQQARH